MKIAIIGTGAMGSVYAGLLGDAGNEVWAIDTWREHIDAIRKNVLDSFNDLCTGCGYCLPCPQGINIPRMMDAYNHKILGGGDSKQIIDRLKWHWSTTPEEATVCSVCGQCNERCTQHLPVSDRMQEIAQLAEEKKDE